jgi:predicted O-methyltransferase YrrM
VRAPSTERHQDLAARARMMAALVRLLADRDPHAKPIRDALRTAIGGRWTPEEAAWMRRIEARRLEIREQEALTAVPEYHPPAAGGEGFSIGEEETTMGIASVVMSISPQWCLLLMRLVRERAPRSCMELGTGFGISAAYQAAALELDGGGELTTLEGAEQWAASAGETFAALGLERISQCVGPIEQTLAGEAARRAPLDFVFVDAEHDGDATRDYFHTLLPHLSDGALVVFDDAHWPDMRPAIDEIARHPRVSAAARIGRLAACAVRAPGAG